MKILVTGGAGFLGSMLIRRLLAAREQGRAPMPFDTIVSADRGFCPVNDPDVESVVVDICAREHVDEVLTEDVVAVYHLASVLSGEAEADVDRALEVNVDATRGLVERCRELGTQPRMVFSSSIAVFGGEFPEQLPEGWGTQPRSSYGATKAMAELLVNEYSRRGFIDARICRLPTISVRPGAPNSAASSFASGILREPLAGVEAICPVPHTTRLWLSSPDTVISNLVHAMAVPAEDLGDWRGLNLPGVSVSVGEMLDALERDAGAETRALVTDQPDELITSIVTSWPADFDVSRAHELGFTADAGILDILSQYKRSLQPSAEAHRM